MGILTVTVLASDDLVAYHECFVIVFFFFFSGW